MTRAITAPLARTAAPALPDAPTAPRAPSEDLARAMALALLARPAGSTAGLTQDQALAVAPEAEARLAAIGTALATPAPPEVIALWVMRIIALIGQPRDADEIELKRAALVDALGRVPRRCITRASAEKVARLCGGNFPSLARILEIITPDADDLRREERRLRAVMARAAAPAAATARTPEETEAMRQTAARAAAELLARARETEQALSPDAAARAAAQRCATDPETPDDELRALASTTRPGAALARMRLAVIAQRRQGARDAGPA